MLAANHDSKIAGFRGGGVALLHQRSCNLLCSNVLDYSSFNELSATLGFDSNSLHVVCLYSPPVTSPYAKSFSVFMT